MYIKNIPHFPYPNLGLRKCLMYDGYLAYTHIYIYIYIQTLTLDTYTRQLFGAQHGECFTYSHPRTSVGPSKFCLESSHTWTWMQYVLLLWTPVGKGPVGEVSLGGTLWSSFWFWWMVGMDGAQRIFRLGLGRHASAMRQHDIKAI